LDLYVFPVCRAEGEKSLSAVHALVAIPTIDFYCDEQHEVGWCDEGKKSADPHAESQCRCIIIASNAK
jgi:hypothetical protein